MQRRRHPDTSTATAAARPAAQVVTAAIAGTLFVTVPLAVTAAPGIALAAVAVAVVAATLHLNAARLRVTLRAALSRASTARP